MIGQFGKNMLSILKTAYRLDRTSLIFTVGEGLVRAVTPFIAILISAYVADGLVKQWEYATMMTASLLGLSLVFLLKVAESYIRKIREVHVEICVRKFNMEISSKTLLMDYELLESPKVTDIRARMRNDDNWGAGFYSLFWQLSDLLDCLFRLTTAVILVVPLLGTAAFTGNRTSWLLLGGLFAVSLAAALFNMVCADRKLFAIMNENATKKTYLGYFSYLDRSYCTSKDVRIYNVGSLIWRYMQSDEEWHKSWKRRFSGTSASGGLVTGLASGMVEGGAYLLVGLQAVAGALTAGSVLKYAAAIYQAANAMSSMLNMASQLSITARRQLNKLEYLKVSDVLPKGTIPVEKRDDNEYEIAFRNVSFRYPGNGEYALKNVNLTLRIGSRMAVVGLNGSGKTTFIKLLCRLYDPTEGEITLNGVDIRKYDYEEYLGLFSVVFQDFRLFAVSLGQNVAADVEYDADRVEQCLAEVGLRERYQAMEKGMETALYKDFDDNGVDISGGEAQKIALARALYKDAPFIVLDEPTAALDPIAEFEIYSHFNTIVRDKTAVYISHRLSSCRFCHNIVVFHEGRIVQQGSHDELLHNERGKYAELWQAQAQYYVEEQAVS